jgi:hypothetical protein
MRKAKRRPTMKMEPPPTPTSTVGTAKHIAPRCRECDKPLTAPATIKRRMCRSCFRVYVVCNEGAR